MKAVQRFDPMVGVRLASFAVHWIRAEIHEFVLRNWRIVKVATTKAQRKLFFNLRRTKKRLGWLTRTEALEIAEDLRVRVEDVFEMEQRLQAHDEPFDGAGDNEDDRPSPATLLGDSRYEPAGTLEAAEWTEFVTERVLTTLETLDERSRNIVTRRWLRQPKAKLRELAAQYGISAERVRQIEAQAFAVLRAAALAGAGVGRTVEGKPRARKRREPPTQTDSAAPEQMSVGHSGQEQERPANPLARTPRALLSRPGKQRSGARQNGARQNTPPTASRKPRPRRKVISLRSQRGASLIG
jgi:alternative sigma factor RpoH